MKRMLALLLTVLLCLPCAFSLAEEAGEPERETFTCGDFEYALLDDGTAEITGYQGEAESLEVPGELDGYAVTAIGDGGAFSNCSSLTAVTIPDSLTAIGKGAFYDCSGLTAITIPDSVTSIGDGAFSYCSGLTSITLPDSLTAIGEKAFNGCDNATFIVGRDSWAKQYCIDNILPYTYADANDWLNE